MAVPVIQIKRGTQAQLAAVAQVAGEPLFVTDNGVLFVSDGSNKKLIGRVDSGTAAARPASVALLAGRLYFATDTGELSRDNGTTWDQVGANDLDNIADGSTYGRVKLTELNTGQVKQLRAVSGAANVTGDNVKDHMDDAAKHREIADGSSGSTDLWSANKIQNTVDSVASGLSWKGAVVAATAAVLPDCAYDNGSSGVGATLTGDNNGALADIDGITLIADDRLLVKNQAAGLQNGIYEVTTLGDGSNPFVLTRVTDCDVAAEVEAAAVLTKEGSTQADMGYVQTADSVTLGTTPLVWAQFTGAGQINAGDGLSKSGNTLNVDVSDFAGTGLEDDGSENLRIAAAAAGDGLQGGAGSALAVDVSDFVGTGLEDDGSENLRLATQGNGIAGGNGSTLSVDSDTETGATVCAANVAANGVGVTVDNSSIKHASNVLEVGTVDGGSFA